MKKLILILLLLEAFINPITSQNQTNNEIFWNFGIPLHLDMRIPNSFNIEAGYQANINLNVITGIGISFSSVRLNYGFHQRYYNFDRNIVTSYMFGGYKASISKSISVDPKIQVGYSFIDYRLVQYGRNWQYSSGITLNEEIELKLALLPKFDLCFLINNSTIFTKFKLSHENTIYYTTEKILRNSKVINQVTIKIGVKIDI